jgi:plasmid stabilization system protein ParE
LVQVVWTRRATADLVSIRAYIGQDSPLAGIRMAHRLKGAGDSLGLFPDRGRWAGGGVREWTVIYPYIIRYTVGDAVVRILRIKHGAQRPE